MLSVKRTYIIIFYCLFIGFSSSGCLDKYRDKIAHDGFGDITKLSDAKPLFDIPGLAIALEENSVSRKMINYPSKRLRESLEGTRFPLEENNTPQMIAIEQRRALAEHQKKDYEVWES